MKTYVLFTMACWFGFVSSQAKIVNGYERDIQSARSSAQHLRNLLPDKAAMIRLTMIDEHILYYELTKALLEQFQGISPSLYAQIDTITDLKGRTVDVYVKFVPTSGAIEGTIGSTDINQLENDQDAYVSEYGPQTVSIRILTIKHSLLILAHEFGHVSYQVPNLATYIEFFSRNYSDRHIQAAYLGHKPNDPSGQKAVAFENQYKKDLVKYNKNTQVKADNPVMLRDQIAKMVR